LLNLIIVDQRPIYLRPRSGSSLQHQHACRVPNNTCSVFPSPTEADDAELQKASDRRCSQRSATTFGKHHLPVYEGAFANGHGKAAASPLSDLASGTKFQPVLDDPIGNQATAKRVVILSGKIYYDLVKERQAQNLVDDVAFIRLEELAPFPFHALHKALSGYTATSEFVYLQEEPRNQGAWPHVRERIEEVLKQLGKKTHIGYRGRKESAVPAPGIAKMYKEQQDAVLKAAFDGF
jgi:hypothetical protein